MNSARKNVTKAAFIQRNVDEEQARERRKGRRQFGALGCVHILAEFYWRVPMKSSEIKIKINILLVQYRKIR